MILVSFTNNGKFVPTDSITSPSVINGKDNCSSKTKFNACKEQSRRNFFSFLLKALKEIKIICPLVYAAITLGDLMLHDGAKKGLYEGGFAFVSIAIVVCMKAIIEYHVHKIILPAIMTMMDRCVVVRGDGSLIEMPISDLSVGNTVFLKEEIMFLLLENS